MSINKEISIDQITVNENGIIIYRESIKIIEDNSELSKSYHRVSLLPGQDLTGQPDKVVAICNAVWTDNVISKYQSQKEIEEKGF